MEERKMLRLKAKESAAEARRMHHTEPLVAPRTIMLAPEALPMAELGTVPSPLRVALRPPHDTHHAREHGAIAEP